MRMNKIDEKNQREDSKIVRMRQIQNLQENQKVNF